MAKITVDQLPVEAHQIYARDQKSLDPLFLQKPNHGPLCNTDSTFIGELEQLLGLEPPSTWAKFTPPKGSQGDSFFKSCILPFPFKAEQIKNNELLKNLFETVETLQKLLNHANNKRACLQKG